MFAGSVRDRRWRGRRCPRFGASPLGPRDGLRPFLRPGLSHRGTPNEPARALALLANGFLRPSWSGARPREATPSSSVSYGPLIGIAPLAVEDRPNPKLSYPFQRTSPPDLELFRPSACRGLASRSPAASPLALALALEKACHREVTR